MADKRRGLGRNLGMLLSTNTTPTVMAKELPIDQLQRGKYQPRRDMHPESLQELADSIRRQGVLQPIVVRPIAEQKYEIIAGERRWRACQLAGKSEVPVILRDVPDEAAMAIALIENIQRENLNPLEEAMALERLSAEFHLTHQQVADAVGKSRATVTNLLRLLQLQPEVKQLLETGQLDMGHARALLTLEGRHQVQVARLAVEKAWSVREVEKYLHQKPRPPKASPPTPSPDLQRLEQRLSDTLGATVKLQHHPKGQGRLTIHYHSLDELDGILSHFFSTTES